MRNSRRWAVPLALALAVAVCGRAAADGMSQATGTTGCLSPLVAGCAPAPTSWFDISDGLAVATQKALVVSRNENRVVSLDRSPATGGLTASGDAADCVTVHPEVGCQDGHDLMSPVDVELDPANRFAYVVSRQSDSLTTFEHVGGQLSELGATGCVRYRGSEFPDGLCKEGGVSMVFPSDVEVPADGRNVYVAARGAYTGSGGSEVQPEAINVMSRNQLTGGVAKLAGTAGCVSSNGKVGCADADAIIGLLAIETTADGRHLLALSTDSNAVTTFARHSITGVLTQEENNLGDCVSADGTDDECLEIPQLEGVRALTISPDSRSVYVGVRPSETQSAIVHLRRDLHSGAMSKPSTGPLCWGNVSGCASQTASKTLGAQLVVSDDGSTAFAAGSGGVRAFTRSNAGVLTPVPGIVGCLADVASPLDGCGSARGVSSAVGLDIAPAQDRLYVLGLSKQNETVANLKLSGPPLGGGLLSIAP